MIFMENKREIETHVIKGGKARTRQSLGFTLRMVGSLHSGEAGQILEDMNNSKHTHP